MEKVWYFYLFVRCRHYGDVFAYRVPSYTFTNSMNVFFFVSVLTSDTLFSADQLHPSTMYILLWTDKPPSILCFFFTAFAGKSIGNFSYTWLQGACASLISRSSLFYDFWRVLNLTKIVNLTENVSYFLFLIFVFHYEGVIVRVVTRKWTQALDNVNKLDARWPELHIPTPAFLCKVLRASSVHTTLVIYSKKLHQLFSQ